MTEKEIKAQQLVKQLTEDVLNEMTIKRRKWREGLAPKEQLEINLLVWMGEYDEAERLFQESNRLIHG